MISEYLALPYLACLLHGHGPGKRFWMASIRIWTTEVSPGQKVLGVRVLLGSVFVAHTEVPTQDLWETGAFMQNCIIHFGMGLPTTSVVPGIWQVRSYPRCLIGMSARRLAGERQLFLHKLSCGP